MPDDDYENFQRLLENYIAVIDEMGMANKQKSYRLKWSIGLFVILLVGLAVIVMAA